MSNIKKGNLPDTNQPKLCPHCKIVCQFPLSGQITTSRAKVSPKSEGVEKEISFSAIYHCLNCGNPVFIRSWESESSDLDVYPNSIPDIPEELPQRVKQIYNEALVCHSVCAWNATAVMCRRAVEETVLILGAKGNTLYNQIEWLSEKRQIAEDLLTWAHEVRCIGRDGAHANIPTNVTQEDANDVVEFTEQFLSYIFILKEKLENRKKRKATSKKSKQ